LAAVSPNKHGKPIAGPSSVAARILREHDEQPPVNRVGFAGLAHRSFSGTWATSR
jgi:hypothetical protein